MDTLSLRAIQKYLNSLVTVDRVAKGFGVSEMCLIDWRAKGLPVYIIPGTSRPAIRYDLNLVKNWAEANGKVFK